LSVVERCECHILYDGRCLDLARHDIRVPCHFERAEGESRHEAKRRAPKGNLASQRSPPYGEWVINIPKSAKWSGNSSVFPGFFCKIFVNIRSNIVVMAEKNDDEYLVKQFSQDNESTFEGIVEQYSADVAVLANRLLGWPGDVEDVVQDIFLAVFVGLKKFRGQCSLKSWLFIITINKCRTYRYKQILWKRKTIPKLRLRLPPNRPADGRLMDNETFNRVRLAVKALPAKYREPIVLRYLQELSVTESSRILGISENTLHVRLNRARECLRQKLAELIEE
jgi:RNA polymerase sigma-70 factor (ECF subfamily)